MITFVDSNVLVYAYDRTAGPKRDISRRALAELWTAREGAISTQVLAEFYVNVTRKLPQPMTRPRARAVLRRYATWPVYAAGGLDVFEASELEQAHSLSFWDALIVVAAGRAGAERLLTEDLQHGRVINGVRIENPFR